MGTLREALTKDALKNRSIWLYNKMLSALLKTSAKGMDFSGLYPLSELPGMINQWAENADERAKAIYENKDIQNNEEQVVEETSKEISEKVTNNVQRAVENKPPKRQTKEQKALNSFAEQVLSQIDEIKSISDNITEKDLAPFQEMFKESEEGGEIVLNSIEDNLQAMNEREEDRQEQERALEVQNKKAETQEKKEKTEKSKKSSILSSMMPKLFKDTFNVLIGKAGKKEVGDVLSFGKMLGESVFKVLGGGTGFAGKLLALGKSALGLGVTGLTAYELMKHSGDITNYIAESFEEAKTKSQQDFQTLPREEQDKLVKAREEWDNQAHEDANAHLYETNNIDYKTNQTSWSSPLNLFRDSKYFINLTKEEIENLDEENREKFNKWYEFTHEGKKYGEITTTNTPAQAHNASAPVGAESNTSNLSQTQENGSSEQSTSSTKTDVRDYDPEWYKQANAAYQKNPIYDSILKDYRGF